MADLLTSLPLTHLAPPGHYGADGAGIRLRVLDQYAMASVSAARQQTIAFAEDCNRSFGVTPIDRPRVSEGGGIAFLGIGPGRWLAVGSRTEKLVSKLKTALGANARICDQSDGYVLFAVEGPSVRDCLAKGPSIDFSPSVFTPGTVATTSMAHIGLIIWRVEDADAFRIAVPSSFAPSFLRLFIASAAEFGITVA